MSGTATSDSRTGSRLGDLVAVEERKQQRRVLHQRRQDIAEAHAVGRQVVGRQDLRRAGGLLLRGEIDLHLDQFLVRPGVQRQLRPHGDLHHAGDGDRACRCSSM